LSLHRSTAAAPATSTRAPRDGERLGLRDRPVGERGVHRPFVVAQVDGGGAGDEHARAEVFEHGARVRHRSHLGRRLDEEDVGALAGDDVGERPDVVVRRPGRHLDEPVAEEPAGGLGAHVRADDRDVALTVRPEHADERRGSGAAGGREDDGDGRQVDGGHRIQR